MLTNILGYIGIVLLVVYATLIIMKQHGPECSEMSLGHGKKKEKIAVLLDRIQWANKYKGRLAYTLRHFVFAFIVLFISVVSLGGDFPLAIRFFPALLVAWVCMVALHKFFDHHTDKFAHYFVNTNANIIRKKLRLRKSRTPIYNPHKFTPSSSAWLYTH